MRFLTLPIPDSFDIDDKQLALLLAITLFEKGKLSIGQAAELAGFTKRAFVEMLGQYDISVFNFPAEELQMDVKNA